MKRVNQNEPFLLMIGDIFAFCISLPLALLVRDFAMPTLQMISLHGIAFLPLLFLVLVLYVIAGLYDERVTAVESVPKLVVNTHLIWAIIAVVYFYILPEQNISPKTTLVIFLIILTFFVLCLRSLFARFIHSREQEKSILIGSGEEIESLFREVNDSRRFPFCFSQVINPEKEYVFPDLAHISFVVVDFGNPHARSFLSNVSKDRSVMIVDARTLFENVFHRIPLTLVDEAWILSNISFAPKPIYDFLKRCMDVIVSLPLALVPLVLYPFVWIGTKLTDKTPIGIVIAQERVGMGGGIMKNIKYRTMNLNVSDKWVKDEGKVTPFGKFLRKSRIDEFPQLWNVLRGDLSLIGPRPDIVGLGKKLEAEIPYYRYRTTIKPGLSGWAQISQKLPPQSVEETKLRLAYDLYYIKNRSFFLDIKIALRTLKTLCSRLGM